MRKEIGPTKNIGESGFIEHWYGEENVIGDISKASKIRIGIKTLSFGTDCVMIFAEEKNKDSKGIIYWMDWTSPNNDCSLA